MFPDPASDEQLDALDALLGDWAQRQLAENPVVVHVERDPHERRWFVRVNGEEKDVYTVWFAIRQRTLHYETYFMPAPEEQAAALYEYLLRYSRELYGASFQIGPEDALYLGGHLDVRHVDEDELDRILGSLYVWTERFFRPAMRIGFASRFKG